MSRPTGGSSTTRSPAGCSPAYDPAGLAALLAGHGLTLSADVGAEDYPGRYPQLRGRRLTLREIERVALAEAR